MTLFNFHKSPKTSTAIAGILLILLCCLYFLAVPKIINIEKYRLLIVRETYKSLKLPVEIGKSKASMTWNLGVKIYSDNIIIKHFDNTAYLSTGPIEVEISIPYILKKQIRVKSINIQNLEIDLKRLPNGKYDIEELIAPKTKKLVKYKTIFHNSDITINNYNIAFTDTFISPSPHYFIYGKKCKIFDFDPKKSIKVNVDGKIYSRGRPHTSFDVIYKAYLPLNVKDILKNQFSISGEINNFYPDMYSKYLSAFTKEYSSLSGVGAGAFIINLARKESDIDEIYFKGTVKDFSLYKPEQENSPAFPGITNVSLFVQQKSKNIFLKDCTFKNRDIDINLNGNIKHLEKPELNLRLTSDNTKAESVLNLLPKQNKHYNTILKRLKRYNIKGVISANLNIKGTAPKLFGTLQLKNFSLSNKAKIISNGDARINFNDKTYNITARASINKNEYFNVSGIVSAENDNINLNIRSNTIKWNSAQRLISAISDIANLRPDFIKKLRVGGTGNINISVSGDIKNPDIRGYLNFLNTKVKHSQIPVLITNLTGRVKFNNKNIILNNLKAKINQSNVNISGILSHDNRRRQPINLNIKAKVNSKDIQKYIKQHTSIPVEAKGSFPLLASVNGFTDDWKLKGRMYFDKGDYINLKQDIGIPLDKARILNFKISGSRGKIKVDKDVQEYIEKAESANEEEKRESLDKCMKNIKKENFSSYIDKENYTLKILYRDICIIEKKLTEAEKESLIGKTYYNKTQDDMLEKLEEIASKNNDFKEELDNINEKICICFNEKLEENIQLNEVNNVRYNDGFLINKESKLLEWDSNRGQNAFYLHGGFHILGRDDKIIKISAGETNTMLKNIKLEWENGYDSLTVLESEEKNKLKEIQNNTYLDYCYQCLSNANGILVTHGVSFADSDDHITKAIYNNKNLDKIYLGVFKDDAGEYPDLENYKNKFKNISHRICYYETNSTTKNTIKNENKSVSLV